MAHPDRIGRGWVLTQTRPPLQEEEPAAQRGAADARDAILEDIINETPVVEMQAHPWRTALEANREKEPAERRIEMAVIANHQELASDGVSIWYPGREAIITSWNNTEHRYTWDESVNGILKPRIFKMTDECLYPGTSVDITYGHCWAPVINGSPRCNALTRRDAGGINMHPVLGDAGNLGLDGAAQIYHLAFAASIIQQTHDGTGYPYRYTPEIMNQIYQVKTSGSAWVLGHRCGNGWCVNPSHMRVITSELNLSEAMCHSFITQWRDEPAAIEVRKQLCFHCHPHRAKIHEREIDGAGREILPTAPCHKNLYSKEAVGQLIRRRLITPKGTDNTMHLGALY